MSQQWTTRSAYDWCRRQTGHYENFTKGSILFPRRIRPFLNAVYAFARYSDDLVDEVTPDPEVLQRFQNWREAVTELDRHYQEHPILFALHDTIEQNRIPRQLFTDLLEAFARDLEVDRYETLQQLLDYCRYSANPVGRIVLHLFAVADDSLFPLSDAICTGLQLVNMLQDVVPDARRGRIYLPLEWVREAGIEQELLSGSYSPAWLGPHEQLALAAERFLREGRELIPLVPRRLRLELRLFIGGGEAALQKVRACGFHPDSEHQLNRRDKTVVAWRALFS